MLIDPKTVELGWLNGKGTVRGVHHTAEQIEAALVATHAEVEERLVAFEAGKPPGKALLVIIDEAAALSEEALNRAAHIARWGLAVGVHLVLCTQNPDALPRGLRSNLDCRVAFKRPDTAVAETLFGHTRAAGLAQTPGRGYITAGGVEGPFQGYYAPVESE